jgi:hypothetical protein
VQRLFSLCADAAGEVSHVHADIEGLRELRTRIDALIGALEAGRVEHDHLFTETWGGEELTATMLAEERAAGYTVIHELKLLAWTPEWAERHGITFAIREA